MHGHMELFRYAMASGRAARFAHTRQTSSRKRLRVGGDAMFAVALAAVGVISAAIGAAA